MAVPGVEARSHSRVKIQVIPIQGDKNPVPPPQKKTQQQQKNPNGPLHTPRAHILEGNAGISASPCQGEVMHRFISLRISSPLKFSPANKFWNRLGSPFTSKKCFLFSCLLRTYFPSLMPNKSQLFPLLPSRRGVEMELASLFALLANAWAPLVPVRHLNSDLIRAKPRVKLSFYLWK